MAETSCKDCKVERGYRPMLDYVSLCPLHAAAAELLTALRALAGHAHFSALEWQANRALAAAREAIRTAEGK